MSKIWEYNKLYDILRYYVDFTTRSGFSSLQVEGMENFPKKGSVIIAPNHRMTLTDALLILQLQHKACGFGARADMFRNPKAAKILRWLRILPLARERDGLKDVAGNLQIFDEISGCLEHSMPFCIFSEGTHRNQKGMMPVRKGIFKIGRLALEKAGEPLYYLPVALEYSDTTAEMGKAAIRIGEAFELASFIREHSQLSEAALYKALCSELQGRIEPMLDRFPERKKGNIALRTLAALLLLPFFIVFAAGSFPIWLPSAILKRKLKDKAWSHTVVFGCRLALPLFLPFWWPFAMIHRYYSHLITDLT